MKKLVFGFLAAVALVVSVTGCHTVRGAGEDVSSVGNTISNNTPP